MATTLHEALAVALPLMPAGGRTCVEDYGCAAEPWLRPF